MRLRCRLGGLLLALLTMLPIASRAQPLELIDGELPRVSLLTFAPGEIYWQRFGHNALLLRARDGRAAVYNYGIFDFHQKNFFLNFARGKMLYRLDADSLYRTLELYAAEDRSVYEQQLDLSLPQRRDMAAFLAHNLRPENVEYRYDYLASNCSTRVRDALDSVLGGGLRRSLQAQVGRDTYRSEVTRLMSPDALLATGMDLALGAGTDRPLNGWDRSFIPEELMRAVRGVRIVEDGIERPLVKAEGWLYRGEREASPPSPLMLWPFLLATGLLLAGVIIASSRKRELAAARIGLAVIGTTVSLLGGVLGLVMLAGWLLTDHWGMWNNQNLLLANPALLFLVGFWLRSWRLSWKPGALGVLLLAVLALMAATALLIKLLPGIDGQSNLAWIGLLLPVQVALAVSALSIRRAGPV